MILEKIAKYLKNNITYVLLTYLGIIFIYGMWAFNDIVTFDSEGFYSISNGYKWYMQWISLGRWGFVLLKYILGVNTINPFFSMTIFFLCFPLSIIIWNFLLEEWSDKKSNISRLCFTGIYSVNSVWALQFAYRNQIEVCTITMLLLPIGVGYFSIWIKERKKIYGFIAFIIITFATSCYQAFFIMYLEGVIIFFLLYTMKNIKEHNIEKKIWANIIRAFIFSISVIIIYFILYKLSKNLYCINYGEEYIGSNFTWNSLSISENIKNISDYIVSRIFGNNIYTCCYAITGICLLIWSLYEALKKHKNIIILFVFILELCPFLLTIVLPGGLVDRASFAYVLATAFMAYFLVYIIKDHFTDTHFRYSKYILFVLILISIIPQLQKTTRLLWTDIQVMNRDQDEMSKMYIRARECGANIWDSICFIGTKNYITNDAYLEHEVIGYSYFSVGSDIDGNVKAIDAMQAYGFPVSYATKDQIKIAKTIQTDMKCWPNEGSVKVVDGLIIIKLGEISE